MTPSTKSPAPAPHTVALYRPLSPSPDPLVKGKVIEKGGENWYRIERTDRMPPFLMSEVSDSDHWLFILSTGALTAGRGNPDHALFPYYTQDKIMDMAGSTGGRTILLTDSIDGKSSCWEPFTDHGMRGNGIERNLEKNSLGNHIILEERNRELGLLIRTSWRPSSRFGFVRKVELVNEGTGPRAIRQLDGVQNILPSGLAQRFQNEFSILGDAYKQCQFNKDGAMGIYHLSSVPTDLASPMEALQANVCWQSGLEDCLYLLSETQIQAFIHGGDVSAEDHARGKRGAFLSVTSYTLQAGESKSWYTCADIDKEPGEIESLIETLTKSPDMSKLIEEDCARTRENLLRMLAQADGLQCTNEPARTMRHASNTVFNLMRGGALVTGYELPVEDVLRTVSRFNKEAANKLRQVLAPDQPLNCRDPWNASHPLAKADRDAKRLVREYLPLSFSRRHGDPSRPWNRFSIEIAEADGSPRFNYQGNWRDIFQNWEALLHSYPEYFEAAIFRFLNTSTADGYNPYRLTKEGFEWEELEPGDAWANIGYWGDHQIIYLLRLLEASARYHPGRLQQLLGEEACVYAEIPYRIRPYKDILKDPRSTIDYDEEWAARIGERVAKKGSDGKLMHTRSGDIVYVSLIEKLLAPLLAKLSNFIPGGGIWMNTQRPEWNDANNALVGYGISVVTLGYVARYLRFLIDEFGDPLKASSFQLSAELATLLKTQTEVFSATPSNPTSEERFAFMAKLGEPAASFRAGLYDNALDGDKALVSGQTILDYARSALLHVEQCLRQNKRDDALWHSYNLIKLDKSSAEVRHLHVMLEGQVSILSAGILDTNEAIGLLRALRESPLYRKDQDSYILYPNKDLPGFLAKNRVSRQEIDSIPLLATLVKKGDITVVRPRSKGDFAFNGRIRNKLDLEGAIKRLSSNSEYAAAVASDGPAILELFEGIFNHHSFTGRSGTFFAYEGLGSIYWHMVSKLVLAVQEIIPEDSSGEAAARKTELIERYRSLRDGLGINKNPAHYGAIPTDAYSHTPQHAGAQQPGMTGQVKEDILIRMTELGVHVKDGCIHFRTDLLSREEFLKAPTRFTIPGPGHEQINVELPADSLAYTFCQVPVIYIAGKPSPSVRVHMADGTIKPLPDMSISRELSEEIFARSGKVKRIELEIP